MGVQRFRLVVEAETEAGGLAEAVAAMMGELVSAGLRPVSVGEPVGPGESSATAEAVNLALRLRAIKLPPAELAAICELIDA